MPEAAWMVPLDGHAAGELWALARHESFGTDPACSRVLDDHYASSRHAELRLSAGRWLLRDLGSTNGSYVNTQRAVGADLRDGDLVQLGQTRLAFKSLGPSRQPGQAPAGEGLRVGWLVPLAGSGRGKALRLGGAVTRVGTSTAVHHAFDDDFMSSTHAEIVLGGGAFTLADLGSSNGSYVNGQRITRQRLIDGDRLRFGRTELVFKAA